MTCAPSLSADANAIVSASLTKGTNVLAPKIDISYAALRLLALAAWQQACTRGESGLHADELALFEAWWTSTAKDNGWVL